MTCELEDTLDEDTKRMIRDTIAYGDTCLYLQYYVQEAESFAQVSAVKDAVNVLARYEYMWETANTHTGMPAMPTVRTLHLYENGISEDLQDIIDDLFFAGRPAEEATEEAPIKELSEHERQMLFFFGRL
jgi:hypothetical protein